MQPTQKTPKNTRLAQRLYQMIMSNLLAIMGMVLVAIVLWVFGYLNTSVSAQQKYNPISRQQAIAYVLRHIKTEVNNVALQDEKSKSLIFSKKDEAKCLTIIDGSKTDERIKTINAHLAKLHTERFLNHRYQLDTDSMVDDFCAAAISESDLLYAIRLLAVDGKLQQLNWAERRDPSLSRAKQIGYVTVPENWLVQTNPWFGLPGCVYVTDESIDNNGVSYLGGMNNNTLAELCNHEKLLPPSRQANIIKTDTEFPIQSSEALELALPDDLRQMYSGLHNLQSSHFDQELIEAYEAYHDKYDDRNWVSQMFSAPINSIDINGADVKIGYNIELTIDTEIQAKVQQIAECMTSNVKTTDCNNILSSQMKEAAKSMHEDSLVRSIGVAVLDVQNQSILALGSAYSDCYAYDNGANNGATNCPKLWKRDWSGTRLMNQAVYQYAPPGSIIKPVQALGIVRSSPTYQKATSPQYQHLKRVMASSDTKQVADHLLCKKTSSRYILHRDKDGVCPGFSAFQQAAIDMGWSANCDAENNGGHCGFKDILFGLPYQSEPMIQSRYFSGRLLTDSKHHYHIDNVSAKNVEACVKANDNKMKGSCSSGGDELNAFMNEVFGAGNAKTSALGAAEMFATLLSADNGNNERRGAHIIEDLWGVDQVLLRPKAWRGEADYGDYEHLAIQPLKISQQDAHQTLGLFYGTLKNGAGLPTGTEGVYKNGTAYSSCVGAIGDCSWMAGKIVAKTGTPGFNYPNVGRYVTTKYVKNSCYNAKKGSATCNTRPYKWFIMGIPDSTGKWDKALAILVERNWKKSGMVDDPKDSINRAAQAGSIIAKSLRSMDTTTSTRQK